MRDEFNSLCENNHSKEKTDPQKQITYLKGEIGNTNQTDFKFEEQQLSVVHRGVARAPQV